MIAILLILFIILLFAALPTWPYSASGRARYHVVSVGERTVRPAKRPQVLSRETPPTMMEDYAAQFRKLQNELQKLDRAADASPQAPNVREADLSRSRQKRAA